MAGPGKIALPLGILFALFASSILEGRQARAASVSSDPQTDIQQPQSQPALQVDAGTVQAYLEKKVDPKYPERAREMRVQGQVILKVIINKKGRVKEISVISGHPLLVPAAIDAVKQWRYRPIRVDGHKVEAQTQVVVNFELG
jgi:TonB family protein